MTQINDDLREECPESQGATASGPAPEPSERLPKWLSLLAWALPDSPELLTLTGRTFKVKP
jgi:hypothetical protein